MPPPRGLHGSVCWYVGSVRESDQTDPMNCVGFADWMEHKSKLCRSNIEAAPTKYYITKLLSDNITHDLFASLSWEDGLSSHRDKSKGNMTRKSQRQGQEQICLQSSGGMLCFDCNTVTFKRNVSQDIWMISRYKLVPYTPRIFIYLIPWHYRHIPAPTALPPNKSIYCAGSTKYFILLTEKEGQTVQLVAI